jgi:hypothetical protein
LLCTKKKTIYKREPQPMTSRRPADKKGTKKVGDKDQKIVFLVRLTLYTLISICRIVRKMKRKWMLGRGLI